MVKKLITIGVILVVGLLVTKRAFANSTSGILGLVTCHNLPVAGALVEAESADGGQILKTTTNEAGFYMINLAVGDYFAGVTFTPGCASYPLLGQVSVKPYSFTYKSFSF